jgi:zinc transport system substrate-binding protein
MIWEATPAEATIGRLEALGVRSIVYSPCANAPEQGDFLSVMRRNATAFEALLR